MLADERLGPGARSPGGWVCAVELASQGREEQAAFLDRSYEKRRADSGVVRGFAGGDRRG